MGRDPKPEVLEGSVRDISHGGDAVVETERGIVMGRGALPGERVRLRIVKRVAGVARGKLLERVETSPDRITPSCELVEQCGGCPLMPLAGEAQQRFKRERFRRVLAHHGSMLEPEWVASPRSLGYRARARLAWHADARSTRVGYRAAGSDTLVDVPACAVLDPTVARGYALLRERLAPELQGRGDIALGLGADNKSVAELVSSTPQPEAVYAAMGALVAQGELAGLSLRVGRDAAPASWGDPRQQTLGADGQALWVAAGGFTQVNPGINALLAERVRSLAKPEGATVLELYAGHGNLTVALAPGAASVVAVEGDAKAAEACRQNLRARSYSHVRVVCKDAADAARDEPRADVVVLDPPRAGAREVLAALLTHGPERIVYVSCDLMTLRRDLGPLLAAGYGIDAALAFDMFPQTAHLETLVSLTR